MTERHTGQQRGTLGQTTGAPGQAQTHPTGKPAMATGASQPGQDGAPRPQGPRRGLTSQVSSLSLQERIWLRALALANRFRVVRTIDIAVHCFAERGYKPALTAAQRAVRGLVKARLLKRYKTDRFMTVYGLTQRGAGWLLEHGLPGAASVRRVCDMSNPEHRLWSQFLVLCCEARGLRALAEGELLQELGRLQSNGEGATTGLLDVTAVSRGRSRRLNLRPDAVCFESDGLTWFEVDRSTRGSDRAASLRALALSIGAKVRTGQLLRRVVVYSKTPRIHARLQATLRDLATETADAALSEGRRQLREVTPGVYEVMLTLDQRLGDGRSKLVDVVCGHVLLQRLPTWLPKYRLDGRGAHSDEGWLEQDYLPYPRQALAGSWPASSSPLLGAPAT